jgi:tetratricopeptide (TPR) repeat protein
MYKKYYSSIVLLLILVLCIIVYWSGLKGNFLFDDYPNLQDLGAYGIIDNWDKFKAFTSNGFAGPTGRPIALASFLIDANSWPTSPYPFKYTNLMIHLLNGVLLCWATLLLLKNYSYNEKKAIWISLVATAIWLLHPYMVSTTLYIVQRMAQLATLFTLIGIVGYLKSRLLLKTKPKLAYLYMATAIVIFTLLAIYSKENGALLPLLILVIEFCNPNKNHKPMWQWRAIFLWLPTLAISLLMLKYVTFADNPWPSRNFNMVERLYSETRIVTEYLFNLIIPQIELKGLYQDGFDISRSFIHPITTLYSTIFLTILFVSSFILRKKLPLFAVAILFFFAAHLMESTVIGLELYFEHRNYTAALFLFLPFASGLYSLRKYISHHLVNLIVIIVLAILSFFTYERAKLWGNTEELQLYWAKISPNSPRAQNSIAEVLLNQGRYQESNHFLEQAIQRMPDSALLNVRLLLQKVYMNIATEQDFIQTAYKLQTQPFDAQAVQALRTLVEYVTLNDKNLNYVNSSLLLINTLEKNAQYNNFPLFQRLMPYLKAKIYLAEKKPDQSLKQYQDAIVRYNDVEAGMMMVAELGSAGYFKQALILLDQVENIYQKQPKSDLKRSSKEYDSEISRIKTILMEQLQYGKKS